MAKLHDVNTTDITDAMRLGCRTMSQLFNADDNDIPFFDIEALPSARMSFSWAHSEAQVPIASLAIPTSGQLLLRFLRPAECPRWI